MIDKLGIVETIDNAIKQDKNERKVTIGEAVKAMLLKGLSSSFTWSIGLITVNQKLIQSWL